MFRFIVTLVLINNSYHSLGSPIATHLLLHPLGKSLEALADRCENQLLASQIKNYIPECDINEPVISVKQMQCLIFYDISVQLCGAVHNSKLVLQNDPIKELNKTIKVNLMCESAQNWKFTELSDFPQYKSTAETFLKNDVKCQKVCDVSELISDDSNIFCKYYKWGSEILKLQPSTPVALEKSTDSKIIAALPDQPANNDSKASGTFSNIITSEPTVKNYYIKSGNTLPKNYLLSLTDTTLTNVEKPEEGQGAKVVQTSSSNTAISGAEINEGQQIDISQKVGEPSPVEISNNAEQLANVQKPEDEEEQPPKKIDIEKEDQILNSQNKEIKEQAVDDLVDDPDTEEDEKQDLADDSEISIGKGDNQKMGEKIEENLENGKNNPLKTTYIAEKPQEEFIPKIPQEDFPEDDDHFFSFFLTAVIIVVLLYVLYHNKSKFTKVILGLIVEGRQPGRRRNSRGHAYRRLDTLEQAMSSNTPAPPSKIIY